MADLKFEKELTALLVIDPYNDFISVGGKFWDRLKTYSFAVVRKGSTTSAVKVTIVYEIAIQGEAH